MRRALILLFMLCSCSSTTPDKDNSHHLVWKFTNADIAFLTQFSLSSLPDLPLAPDNNVANNLDAAKFGKKLFFDARFSHDGNFSCASCHQPGRYFTDGLAVSQATGITRRNAPSLFASPWGPWQYWDGRKDSLWSQALGPIENPKEQNITRTEFVSLIQQFHLNEYQSVFGELPSIPQDYVASPLGNQQARKNWSVLTVSQQNNVNRVFSNAGKALMAYQRQLRLPSSRFDQFVDALSTNNMSKSKELFSIDEVKGLRLFMGRANCASCHNGSLFTNFEFHNIGAPEADKEQVDMGRYSGVASLIQDEFTCLSQWSDANAEQCEEMLYLKRQGPELVGAFKTPTLRNIAATSPYMQSGQFNTLKEVLDHYNTPKPPYYDRKQHPNRPHFDILPLQLSDQEMTQIIRFMETLTSPVPKNDPWWFSP